MDFITYGYNYRLPELQCIMLIKQLEKLNFIVKERISIQNKMIKGFAYSGYEAQYCGENALHNVQSLVFKVPQNVNRDKLILHLKNSEIESTIGTYCLSNCTYYKNKYDAVQPNAMFLEDNTITLPCYCNVDVEKIIEGVLKYNG